MRIIDTDKEIAKQDFLNRRKKFFAQMQNDEIAMVFAATKKIKTNDVHYKFRQDNNFWYLTGFPEYNAIAVFFKTKDKEEYWLFCQEINHLQTIWDGKVIGCSKAKELYGVDKTFRLDEFKYGFNKLMNGSKTQSLIEEHEIEECRLNTFHGREILKDKWLDNKNFKLIDHLAIIHSLRLEKDAKEIEMLQQAVDLSVEAHIKAMQFSKPGVNEYEVAAILSHEFNRHNCEHAYLPIVAAGINANTLHYIANSSELEDGDLILIDSGAEYQNYASDITRTFPINGKFTKEQKIIYQLVLEMQETGFKAVKPGVAWNEIQDQIIRVLVEGLINLKILTGKVEDQLENGSYKQFYPHSFGHWLGLDVHDVGKYINGESFIKLREGMVLTVEPGVYISKDMAGVDNKWHNISIRIEDDVVVTKDGCDVLSKNLPKTIEDIENCCKRN